jgi:uncharacterized membrane protein YhaH (DUF805 family)
MNPFEYAILPFRRYVDFKGRSSRSEIWWFFLLTFVIGMIIQIIAIATFDPWSYSSFRFIDVISWAWSLFILLPQIAVQVRRLHDINRTGLWLLCWAGLYVLAVLLMILGGVLAIEGAISGFAVMLILTIGISIGCFVWQIVWYCLPPVDDNNRFGPNPLLIPNPAPSMRTPAPTRGVNNPMPTTSPVSGNMDSSSVNDRLKDLNKMFEDGLIDEKDFKSKKKTLLDEL